MNVFPGIDWAEDHHDAALVDADGKIVGTWRISDDAAGFTLLVQLLAEAGDSAEEPIPVASGTSSASARWLAYRPPAARSMRSIRKAVDRYRDQMSARGASKDARP
jgi:hypothetical protein